jgi:hypothetical protein
MASVGFDAATKEDQTRLELREDATGRKRSIPESRPAKASVVVVFILLRETLLTRNYSERAKCSR